MQIKLLSILVAILGIVQISNFQVEATNIKPPQDILAGIWKYQSGNEVFIVSFLHVIDGYRGHYKKITVDASGNQVAEVYNSDKPIGNTTTNWPYVIYAGNMSQNNEIGAIIADNTLSYTPNAGGFIDGYLDMKILNPNCFTAPSNTCALQALWTVKKRPGLQDPNEPNFNIPTNIILTKQ
jgi:hypothetical protein